MPMYSAADYRTDAAAVRDLIRADSSLTADLDILSDEQIQTAGLDPAHLEVEEGLTGEGMSAERLEQIELFLAVDYLLDGGIDEVRALDSESRSDGSSDSYADAPDYREKAKRLDTSGVLDGLEKPTARTIAADTRGDVSHPPGRR